MSALSSPSSTLALLPVTEEDLPLITKLWYDSMPAFDDIWPNTPAGHAWWDAANLAELNQPNRHYLKVVDTAADNRLIAYGKWDFALFAEQRGGPRFPPWCADSKPDAANRFVDALESERKRLCGDAPSYYLDMLATHPEWERRGAASLIMQWGCEKADKAGVLAYVDASAKGKGIYTKFGFQDKTSSSAFPGIASMIRYPNPQ